TAVRMALADKVSGMTAALSIVSALHAARNRGVGQYIKVPMLEAMMAFAANDTIYGYTFLPEEEYKHQAPKTTTLNPFKTKDGWITIAPFTDEQYQRIHEGAGKPEWWHGVSDRMERVRGVLRGIAKLFPEKTTIEWLPILEKADVPCGPVHTYDSLFNDPEIVANDSFHIYEHPTAGKVRTVGTAARFGESPMSIRRVPPKLGEHTEQELGWGGLDGRQVEELGVAKVING